MFKSQSKESNESSDYYGLSEVNKSNSDPSDNYDKKDKNFFQRAFSPLHSGAMRGSIFALLASTGGTGIFNLPYRVNQVGVINYAIYLLLGGLFSYLGMYCLSRLIHRFKFQSYSEMCYQAYGNWFKRMAQICLLLWIWGLMVCQQVILSKFVVQLLAEVFGMDLYVMRQQQYYTDTGNLIRILVNVTVVIINSIFIFKKQVGFMQKMARVGILATIFNTLVIVITLFTGFSVPSTYCVGTHCQYHGILELDWSQIKLLGKWDWDDLSHQMQGFASLMFCYVNHHLLFPLMYDLKHPTKRRMDKIFMRVHITEILAYFLVGMAGYLLLAEHTPFRVINPVVMISILTTIVVVGKFIMVFALFFTIPLNIFPARHILYESFEMQKNTKNHIILTLALALSGLAVSIFVTNVSSYFAVLGGTAGVMMSGGFPAICYYKIKGLRTFNQKLIVSFITLVVLCGFYGAILAIAVPA